MKKFFNEFKTFISKGNVMDLAVAFIIGAAFKEIINSLVKDILTPVISLVAGDEGFANYKYVITKANEETGVAENAIYYGNFIQSIIDFLIVALVIFFIIKFINRLNKRIEDAKKKTEEVAAAVVEKASPKVEDILLDIKNLLKKDDDEKKKL